MAPGILGRHLQVRTTQARGSESAQGLRQQAGPQSLGTMQRSDPQVLDGTVTLPVAQSLDRATVLGSTVARRLIRQQPGGAGHERVAPRDFFHQPATALSLTQARKHVRVDLATEAAVLGLGVMFQQGGVPRQDASNAAATAGSQTADP